MQPSSQPSASPSGQPSSQPAVSQALSRRVVRLVSPAADHPASLQASRAVRHLDSPQASQVGGLLGSLAHSHGQPSSPVGRPSGLPSSVSVSLRDGRVANPVLSRRVNQVDSPREPCVSAYGRACCTSPGGAPSDSQVACPRVSRRVDPPTAKQQAECSTQWAA